MPASIREVERERRRAWRATKGEKIQFTRMAEVVPMRMARVRGSAIATVRSVEGPADESGSGARVRQEREIMTNERTARMPERG